jgi:hypothetical protein
MDRGNLEKAKEIVVKLEELEQELSFINSKFDFKITNEYGNQWTIYNKKLVFELIEDNVIPEYRKWLSIHKKELEDSLEEL